MSENHEQHDEDKPAGKVPVPKRPGFPANFRKTAKPDFKQMSKAPQHQGKGSRRTPMPRGNSKGK